jgi:hypothetical protein
MDLLPLSHFATMRADMVSEKPQTEVSPNSETSTEEQSCTNLSDDKQANHNGLRLISICVGMCLAVFLVGLSALSIIAAFGIE